ncbi:hypothetical protein PAER4782_34010 (plasmid) [Pseudomonas aeruginosa]|nr:hypothetical protein PAER4782_34010 [Pseudomonas aeruginosa]CAI9912102.1 hypothetical protein PAER4782_34010 [Pseudomonas aeruginosa]
MQRSHNRMIKFLEKELEWVNTRLTKEVALVTEWQETYKLLLSVPGIGLSRDSRFSNSPLVGYGLP